MATTQLSVLEGQDLVRAAIDPTSIDPKERTFDVVWSTGARAMVQGEVDGSWLQFDEELSLDPKAWDLARVENGTCPLLNEHDGFFGPAKGVENQLGRVLSVSFTRREARARCQFSFAPEHEGTWINVQKGIIRGISPRYRVKGYEEITKPKDARRVFRTTLAELREISLTTVPADPGGRVRSDNQKQTYIAELKTGEGETTAMPPELDPKNQQPATNNTPPATPPVAGDEQDRARGGNPPPAQPPATPPTPGEQGDQARGGQPPRGNGAPSQLTPAEIRANERARVDGINEVARTLRLEDAEGLKLVARLINQDSSLEAARHELVFERARRDMNGLGSNAVRVEVGQTELDKVRSGVENALLVRMNRLGEDGKPVKLSEHGRNFHGRDLARLAEEMLAAQGVRVRSLSKHEICGVALNLDRDIARSAGMHSTSDFPNLLSNLASKSLRAAYSEVPSDWKMLSRQASAQDFKPMNRLQIGEAPQLEKVNEHGEFKRGTITEGKETYSVEDYGKIFAITRKALINDDLSAFDRLPMMFGRQAAELEAQKAIGLLLANPTMGDGNQLFSVAHANTSTGALSIAALAAAQLALVKQVGLDGRTLVGNRPRFLFVPAALHVAALQFTAQITPNASGSVNPFVGMFERVISEPRLDIGADGQAGDAVKWFMAGDPRSVDILEHAYLAGQEGVYLETKEGFEVDGMQMKVRHTFGVAVLDWRGIVRSTGT